MAEIRLEGIGKSFGQVKVVDDLDLVIRDGEFFTLLGPSGCGKSTILNMIAGLEGLTKGKIFFDGDEVSRLSPRQRDVAMVFQNYALYPHMSVFDNIAFPLRMQKTARESIRREVQRVVSLLGLEGLERRRPSGLSGGQRQRVALARAIVRRPRVFLMDEPFSNLDARLRVGMRAELKRLQKELRITTVFVTHDQGEAMSLSDRMAVFNDGRIQQCGRPLEVYREPANMFVGGLIGSPPMNFFDATLSGIDPVRVQGGPLSFHGAMEGTSGAARGSRIVIGIRPEDLVVSREAQEGALRGSVTLVEPAGPLVWVDVLLGDIVLRGGSSPAANLNVDDEVFVKVTRDQAILFEKSTGKRIGRGKKLPE